MLKTYILNFLLLKKNFLQKINEIFPYYKVFTEHLIIEKFLYEKTYSVDLSQKNEIKKDINFHKDLFETIYSSNRKQLEEYKNNNKYLINKYNIVTNNKSLF